MSLITRVYNSQEIRQRADGYLSLTDMARATGKQVGHWLANQSTAELLHALKGSIGIPIDRLVEANESAGPNETRGTWAHPRVSIAFATWCSGDFFALVTEWVHDVLSKGYALRPGAALDLSALLGDTASLQTLALALTQKVQEQAATVQAQAAQIAENQPKVEAHARLMDSTGGVGLMNAGRVLGRRPRIFINELVRDGILYRDEHGTPLPTAQYMESGYFEVVTVAVVMGEQPRPVLQTKVTGKGLDYLSKLYPKTDKDGGSGAPALIHRPGRERSH